MSRTRNSTLNIASGLINQLLLVALNFISRTVFINILGIDYLGINGLFNNILSVLSLAELGIGTAIVYSMYRPLAENDQGRLTALINYYKKLYRIIALIITITGLLLIPFLENLIKLEKPIDNIKLYYLIFLLDSVVSYLFAYKTSILTADQKLYRIKIYNMGITILKFVIQIIILILTHSYVLYILIQVLCTMLLNLICAQKATFLYPYIKGKEQLSNTAKREIWLNIKSFFLYQIGGVVLNSTSNILISVIVGTAVVGYYSNYNMIITQIAGFTSIIFISLQASVGNLNTEGDNKKQYFIFKVMNLLSFLVYGFCSVCFCILFQDFITLWLGREFNIDIYSVHMAVTTFYLQGVLYPIWCYRQTIGLFKHTKYIMLYASIVNLGLSFVLGYIFGLVGILAATVIARLTTNIWFEPYKLHNIFFNVTSKKYFIKQIINVMITSLTILVINIIVSVIPDFSPIINIIIKAALCVVCSFSLFYFAYRKTDEYKYLLEKISRLLMKIFGAKIDKSLN